MMALSQTRRERQTDHLMIVEVDTLLDTLSRHAPALYDQAVAMGLVLVRALRQAGVPDADCAHYLAVGQLYELGVLGMAEAEWSQIPESCVTRLSGLMLMEMGQPAIADDVIALECEPQFLSLPLQIVKLFRVQFEVERTHGTVPSIVREAYSAAALRAFDAASAA